jgi:hypothetical protein
MNLELHIKMVEGDPKGEPSPLAELIMSLTSQQASYLLEYLDYSESDVVLKEKHRELIRLLRFRLIGGFVSKSPNSLWAVLEAEDIDELTRSGVLP